MVPKASRIGKAVIVAELFFQMANSNRCGNDLRAQLLRGGVGSLLVKAGHAVLAFAVAVVLARVLGPDGYGVYAFALAILMFIAIPAQVGIPQLMVRETAKAQAKEDWALMRGLWRWGNIAVAAFTIIGSLSVGLVLVFLGDTGSARASTITIGVALIPLVALANVRAACLRGLRMVVWGQIPESIFRPVTLLLLMGLWLLILAPNDVPKPHDVMGLHVVAAIIAFMLGAFLLRRARPKGVSRQTIPKYSLVAWRKAVIPLAMVSGLQLINSYTDLIMLGIFRPDEEVGIYRAAFQLAMLVVFGFQAANQVLQPHFARLYEQGDIAKLQQVVTSSARGILALALPPVLIFMMFGGELLAWAFGDPFRAGAIALAILAAGQLTNAGIGSVGILLNMTNHERDTMRGVALAAIVNVILNALLIPMYGIAGAAFATASTFLLLNIILWLYVRKRLRIESSILGRITKP